ncbi:hypothetical protein CsSME_00038623 [Camellia sinensis var. sinensis]
MALLSFFPSATFLTHLPNHTKKFPSYSESGSMPILRQ